MGAIYRYFSVLTAGRYFKLRLTAESLLVGILAGLVVSLFRYALDLTEAYRPILYGYFSDGHLGAVVFWFFLLFLMSFLVCFITRRVPMTAGSGIPQLKGILRKEMQMNFLPVLLGKLAGAVLGQVAGLSLGRQGPSVKFGACVGQGVSRMLHRTWAEERCLLISGAGAGLAAVFNAPLAGMVFALEELSNSFSPRQMLSAIAAAVAATAVSRFIFGAESIFPNLNQLPVMPIGTGYLIFCALGVFGAVFGMIFNRSLLYSLDLYDRLPMSALQKFMLPFMSAGVLGFFLPEILGGGNTLVERLLSGELCFALLFLLLAGKFLFTMLCFGSGTPGGIFLPMMALGATVGAIFGKAMVLCGLLSDAWLNECILFGMAAYFTGAVKAPVSSSILVMELAGNFDHMLSISCVALSAYLVTELSGFPPAYEALLCRSLQKKERSLKK